MVDSCADVAVIANTDGAKRARLERGSSGLLHQQDSARIQAGRHLGSISRLPQDYAEAAKWYRLAADQGDAQAQYNLGVMYDLGQGVPQDDAKAVKWYRLAADQGFAQAQYKLGIIYDNGKGVPRDHVVAHIWFNLAAAQGFDSAAKKRVYVVKSMTREQMAVYACVEGAGNSRSA